MIWKEIIVCISSPKNISLSICNQPDYEGELEAELSRENTENGYTYVLVVHLGDSVVTIFFENLKVETHLYRYGDLGHFWVKGYEYLILTGHFRIDKDQKTFHCVIHQIDKTEF